MRMKPRQFENRCTHNKVHFVLSEQLRLNPFWSQPATLSNLGKGPRFIFVAGPLSTTEVLGACARLNYRMVRAFKHNVKRQRSGGAGTKSAKKSRKQSPGRNFAEADQSAALEARGGTKKWRRRSVEARERDDPALAPSSAAEPCDCPRKTGSKGSGKQGVRRSRSAANKDQE